MFQSIFSAIVFCISSGLEKNPASVPPVSAMCMSVILWKVMKTGAKKVFISTLTQKATNSLPQLALPANHTSACSNQM